MSSANFGGPWTQQKLQILRRYLDAYTTALKNQPFTLTYVDAFAGEGYWTPASGYELDDYGDFTGVREGSPRIALGIQDKAFDRLAFIEKDVRRVRSLRSLLMEFPDRDISIVNDDANVVLPRFCDRMEIRDRAIVFLDPFATEVAWSTVEAIARTGKIDCWILFPLMAVARLMTKNSEPTPLLAARLDRTFGGREHWHRLYSRYLQGSLFGDDILMQTRPPGSGPIADLYRERLASVFAKVASRSRVLTNSRGSPMFELFFAAGNRAGASIAVRIANHILTNW